MTVSTVGTLDQDYPGTAFGKIHRRAKTSSQTRISSCTLEGQLSNRRESLSNAEDICVIYDAQDMKYESIGKAYRRLIVSSCVLWRCMGCKVLPGAVSHVM